MRFWILTSVVVLPFLCASTSLYADGVFLEGGFGVFKSTYSQALFISYQKDSSPIFGLDSFNEITLGLWNGGEHNNAIALSKGILWNFHKKSYTCIELGGAYVTSTSCNLGTHLQFALSLALGTRIKNIDFSVGFKHFSNGKKIFYWTNETNDGENFITLQIGYLL